jgi:hypothetical protein
MVSKSLWDVSQPPFREQRIHDPERVCAQKIRKWRMVGNEQPASVGIGQLTIIAMSAMGVIQKHANETFDLTGQ